MTATEFGVLADRISLLWPPPMAPAQIDAYWRVLEPLEARQLDRAITLIARQPRPFRPDAGLLYETASAQPSSRLALPAGDVDPVSPEDHERVLAEERRRQSAEHRRRHEAVVDLLRATGYRVPLTALPTLMAAKFCSDEDFDRRMAAYRAAARKPADVAR